MRVRIVVLNWNGRDFLDACLTSLEAACRGAGPGTDVEVVLVDNASDDDSVAFVHERFPGVRLLALPANHGFAGGNNRGAAGFTGDALVFLNNDTRVASGWLAAVLDAARDPNAGLVTSHVVTMTEPARVDSAGDGYLRCGGAYKMSHGVVSASLPAAPREVFGACGAAFLIRRDLFERLGGFDESFFLVYEDVDLSYRARLLGARVVYAPDAVVAHAGSASMGKLSTPAVYHGQRNLEWTWLKNTPARLLWRSIPSHVAYDLAGFAAYARQGHAWTWLRAKMAALAGVPRVLAARRAIQRRATVDPERLWQLMDADWIAIKRAEKRAQFR